MTGPVGVAQALLDFVLHVIIAELAGPVVGQARDGRLRRVPVPFAVNVHVGGAVGEPAECIAERGDGLARLLAPILWTWMKQLITPHPLGGCRMADDPSRGVVDHRGEVFGYPNLFVIDGAAIPVAIGLNPSKTIAAVAERAAALMTR